MNQRFRSPSSGNEWTTHRDERRGPDPSPEWSEADPYGDPVAAHRHGLEGAGDLRWADQGFRPYDYDQMELRRSGGDPQWGRSGGGYTAPPDYIPLGYGPREFGPQGKGRQDERREHESRSPHRAELRDERYGAWQRSFGWHDQRDDEPFGDKVKHAVERGEEWLHDAGESIKNLFQGNGPKNWVRSDERIREDVCEALTDDPRVDASDIEVLVVEGEVTLTGSVDQRVAKVLAERLADEVRGVKEVLNQLRIERSRTASGASSLGSGTASASSPSPDATTGASSGAISSGAPAAGSTTTPGAPAGTSRTAGRSPSRF